MFQEHIASVFVLKDGGDIFPQNVGLSELRDIATQKGSSLAALTNKHACLVVSN